MSSKGAMVQIKEITRLMGRLLNNLSDTVYSTRRLWILLAWRDFWIYYGWKYGAHYTVGCTNYAFYM